MGWPFPVHTPCTFHVSAHASPGPADVTPQTALLALVIVMRVCLYQSHISVVSQLAALQIRTRYSTCFCKGQDN